MESTVAAFNGEGESQYSHKLHCKETSANSETTLYNYSMLCGELSKIKRMISRNVSHISFQQIDEASRLTYDIAQASVSES